MKSLLASLGRGVAVVVLLDGDASRAEIFGAGFAFCAQAWLVLGMVFGGGR